MSFVDKLLPKDKPSEYFLTLKVGISSIYAIVWEVKGDKIVIIGRGEGDFEETSDDIEAADRAISDAEKNLPEGKLVEKVIFGLPLQFISQDKIKPAILVKLKKLTQKLSLTPLGFIELPQAIAHHLKTKEDTTVSAILLGITKSTITVSLLRVGKIFENITVNRGENILIDVDNAIKKLTAAEVLPSKILVYDEDENLEKIKEELIKYPWQKKSAFLHVPKIEVIGSEEIINALIESAASEIVKTVSQEEFGQKEAEVNQKEPVIKDEGVDETGDLSSLGFLKNVDVRSQSGQKEETNQEELQPPLPDSKSKIALPKMNFSLPKMPSFQLPTFAGFKFLPIVVILFILLSLGALGAFAYWQLPKADVTVLVGADNMQKDMDITLSPNVQSVDKDKLIIPANAIDTQVNGDKTASTSGKKNVGNPARGTVTLYNKTTNSKTFPSGTILIANSLKFSLDSEASVASASDTGEGLTYGKTDVKISASNLGPEGNLSSGTTFSFADFPGSSYSAKNNDALSGGTSRQVSAVSKADQDNLLDSLSSDLKEKAKSDLFQKKGNTEKILDESIKLNFTNKKFDKNVDTEGATLTLSLSAKMTAFSYKEEDLNMLAKASIINNIPDDFEFAKDQTTIKVNDSKPQKDGSLLASATVTARLTPKVALDKIQKELAGKTITAVQDILKNEKNVVGVEIHNDSPFPFKRDTLPLKEGNIKVSIASR